MTDSNQSPKEKEEAENFKNNQIDSSAEKTANDQHIKEDDEGYTENEIPFADGKGTTLNDVVEDQHDHEDTDQN